jgi:acetyltransferase-like isoleucine patch superfamily enzyme
VGDATTLAGSPSALARDRTMPSGPAGRLVREVFRIKRAWYRLRYRRLTLGRDVQIRGRLRLRRGVTVVIGDRCRLNKLVRFAGPGEVRIGPDCLINGSWIGSWTTITVGAGSLLSDCELVDNTFHNLDPARRHAPASPGTRAPITIGDNVWVGAGALVMKGVSIGRDAVVGAATVVRSDVPDRVVVIGNPQQIVKRFDD